MTTPVREFIRTSAVGESIQKRIREGVPEIGWAGDPFLTLCWNKIELRFEVWDERDEKPGLVFRSRQLFDAADIPDVHQLCSLLRDRDLRRRGIDEILEEIDSQNEALLTVGQDQYKDQQMAALERVYGILGGKTLW